MRLTGRNEPLNAQEPPHAGKMKQSHRQNITYIACLLVILTIVGIWIYLYNNQDCSVGITGTAASVEFHGPRAGWACDATVTGSQGNNGSTVSFYHETGTPEGSEICSGKWGDLTYTVRDSGLFDLVGKAECTWFANNGASP